MTEFQVGDVVRLTKGKRGEPGFIEQVKRVGTYTDHLRYESVIGASDLSSLIRVSGWTVELISRPLPTKPNTLGWATVGGVRRIVRLNDVGTWILYDEGGFDYVVLDEDLSDFTEAVLIPKELADRVTEWAERDAMDGYRLLGDLADHLKGQDDE